MPNLRTTFVPVSLLFLALLFISRYVGPPNEWPANLNGASSSEFQKDEKNGQSTNEKLVLVDEREESESFPRNNVADGDKSGRSKLFEHRKCLLKGLTPTDSKAEITATYRDLTKIIRKCTENLPALNPERKPFDSFAMGRFGESKYFVKPAVNQVNECRFLTIGIGGDFHVEKMFKEKYPHCQIYGIEPSSDQFEHFGEYGTVIHKAVGTRPGKILLTVRKGKKMGKQAYVKEEIEVVPLPQILDQYMNGTRLIHYSTLDIEGFEFTIARGFQYGYEFNRGGDEGNPITICQLDVEFHDISWPIVSGLNEGHFNFVDYFRDFISQSPFVPVKANNFNYQRKVNFVNVESKECNRLFRISDLFQ